MKETEFDRYERMKKLERELEVEKRKSSEIDEKGKDGKPHLGAMHKKQNKNQIYAFATGDDYDDYDKS